MRQFRDSGEAPAAPSEFEIGALETSGPMSPIDWIALFVCIAGVVGAAVRLRRGEIPPLRPVPAVWPWSAIAWRAYVRCLPSMVVAGALMLAVFAVVVSVPERSDGHRPAVVVVPVLVVLALGILAVLLVAAFNRPRFLVPRDLRQEQGAITELLARRRRRSADGPHVD